MKSKYSAEEKYQIVMESFTNNVKSDANGYTSHQQDITV